MTTFAEVNETFSRLEATALRIKEQRYDAIQLLERIRMYANHKPYCPAYATLAADTVCQCRYREAEDAYARFIAEITA